jgi:TetR/AcrR family transcriptional regulator, mexJK operon transcriptional repressor
MGNTAPLGNTAPMGKTARMGRRVDPAKEVAILAAARTAFLEQPYDRVSMDSVAARAGVSKVTIYAKYQSKEVLFIAAMNEGCAAIYNKTKEDAQSGAPLDQALSYLGVNFMTMILAPEMAALHGVMIQVAQDRPEITSQYYQVVVEASIATLAETLQIATKRGVFACTDARQAAVQFIAMVQGVYRYENELGVSQPHSLDELTAYIDACVAMFLRAYRVT